MLGTLLIQLAVIASRSDLEAMLCQRVIKFMDALAGVIPYSPYIDFGNDHQEINGTGSVYFCSNLRMPQNCSVEHPMKNKKTMKLSIIEDMIIFLDNGLWISVKDCEMTICIDVVKDGDQVSMKTTLQEVFKFGNVSINDCPDVDAGEVAILKNCLTKTMSTLCDKYLSFSFCTSCVVIDQNMAVSLLQQVYKVFLTVL